jgi:Glycosyltransferase like family 2
MATPESPGAQALPGNGGGTDVRTEVPTVTAVVVTRGGGVRIEETLRSLGAQTYPSLAVIVVDAGPGDDPTVRIRAILPKARVRRMPHRSFAGAANEALHEVRNASFLLICRDDVALDPSAVRVMLEEAYRSNAGIVGPKLIDFDNPDVLLEVGRSIDRFGFAHTGIEPGELDHAQHDGVREVFYVSDTAMLVRTDLFDELGGFDPAASPGSEDLDLCWRARLAGARVLVAPDARVRGRDVDRTLGDGAPPDPHAAARSRIRTVLTLSPLRTLLWVVPVALAASFIEALALVFRRDDTRSALGAWRWNFQRIGAVRRARRKARARRRVDDRGLRDLQVRATQVRGFVSHHVATEDRVRSVADAARSAIRSAAAGVRQPVFALAAVLALVWLVGSRALLGDGVPAIGSIARWVSVGDLLSTYASGWRYTGLGSSTAAPPGLMAMAGLSTAFFGADGLARTLLVVASFPVGAFGAYRLTRDVTSAAGPAVVAALAYAVNPVPRNAIANGRMGPLVVFTLAPLLIALALRAAQPSTSEAGSRRLLRTMLGLSFVLAFATAWYPLAPLVLFAATAAMFLAAPFVRGVDLALRLLLASLAATVLAGVLLLPWSVTILNTGGDGGAIGFSFPSDLDLVDVLSFQSGPNGAGIASCGLLGAAAFALALGRGPQFTWATRAWMLALVGWALVWLPSRFATDSPVLAPEAGLSLAALGIAVAAGIGASAIVSDIRGAGFGRRQAMAVLATAGFLLGVLGFVVDAGGGRWRAPDGDWPETLAFLETERDSGGFRVLWVGDPTVLPLDPVVTSDGTGYVLTRNGPGDARELWRARSYEADDLVGDAVTLAASRRTERLGHLLAPMSVRYVAIPDRSGPGAERTATTGPVLRALDDQLDLARLESTSGLVLYENTAWIPNPGTVRPADARDVPLRPGSPTDATLRADIGRVRSVRGSPSDSEPTGPGIVLWSEANDPDWSASSAGRDLRHVEPFGWANGFDASERASVAIRYDGQLRRYGFIMLQAALWIAFLALVWISRPDRRARPTHVRRQDR